MRVAAKYAISLLVDSVAALTKEDGFLQAHESVVDKSCRGLRYQGLLAFIKHLATWLVFLSLMAWLLVVTSCAACLTARGRR